ncbi:MAG: tyrosine--tRNA ligase [Anaerolineae bacterium]
MTQPAALTTAERVQLITRNAEEVIGADEIAGLIDQGMQLRHYIGLEISGKLHLGTGLMCMQIIRDLQRAGVQCVVFLADWHTWINDKLGGDRTKIQRVAGGYFKEGLKASLAALGGDPESLEFVLGSDLYHHNDQYWETLIEVGKNTTLSRIERSISIMGRQEGESVDFAKLIYPPMQVTDIFALKANIAHGGMDQRKAHVIARDVANYLHINPLRDSKGNVIKPIIIHHHLLLGLDKPPQWPLEPEKLRELRTAMKMSKSKPKSAVFIHDTPDEIRSKIRKAFCPPPADGLDFNPVLDWVEHLVFRAAERPFEVTRKAENGGDITYNSIEEVKVAYSEGSLHPGDLKNGIAEALINILAPVRKVFDENAEIKAMWSELEAML